METFIYSSKTSLTMKIDVIVHVPVQRISSDGHLVNALMRFLNMFGLMSKLILKYIENSLVLTIKNVLTFILKRFARQASADCSCLLLISIHSNYSEHAVIMSTLKVLLNYFAVHTISIVLLFFRCFWSHYKTHKAFTWTTATQPADGNE